jgi:hypothetical protein
MDTLVASVRGALEKGLELDSGHGAVSVPAWTLQLALCLGVGTNVLVLGSIAIGRLCMLRGSTVNGRLFGDHLSCRSLAWWELWVLCPRKGVSHPGDAKPEAQRQSALGSWKPQQAKLESGWRFVGAAESHRVTEANMASRHAHTTPLSGESAGRQTWVKGTDKDETPSFDASKNPNASDLVFRAQRIRAWKSAGNPVPDERQVPKTAEEAAAKAVGFYQMLLCDDGHFAGDYGGPMFLMPGLIIACYVSGVDLAERKSAMITYLRNHQQTDGGWGTHIESPSTMFGSVLSYVSLRLLGVDASDAAMVAARNVLHKHGGALTVPSWAKFWLCVLGVHEWEGINSIPAEMWLLPFWFPFHPGKLWCHCRMVYLPMCYLYCKRFKNPKKDTDPVLQALRKELYTSDYASIRWDRERHSICPLDNYSPVTVFQKCAHNMLAVFETYTRLFSMWPFSLLRRAGIKYAIDYIKSEDIQTNWICIGPVNKVLNMLCVWVDNGNTPCESFYRHVARLDDYLWVAEDGMKMQAQILKSTLYTPFIQSME